MFYTINKTINFRDTDGLIWLESDESSGIVLTTTTSRLLAFLLERQGRVINRDEILSHVWDAHGLRSSNNSLNKYISDLRNIFRNLGHSEEIIITVPRIGFMLSTDIVIEKHTLAHRLQDGPAIITEKRSHKRNRGTFIIIASGLIIISLLSVIKDPFFIIKNTNTPARQKIWPVGNINGCSVFSFMPASVETTKLKLEVVEKILDSEKMTCRPNGDIYFQAAEPVLYGAVGRVFLSICRSTDLAKMQFSSCYNFYETAYEIKK